MVILDVQHPDVVEFIDSKVNEEKKAWALIEAGYDASFTGEAYGSIFFQNGNHSVRVNDEFMQAVESDGTWQTRAVVSGEPVETLKARDVFRKMAEAAWVCGDPGIQYDTAINDWHTSSNSDRIYASNPCSEYMFLNDTACNLASLNLMKFVREDGEFDVESDRREQPPLPTARAWLRQPRRALDEPWPGVRLGRGARLRGSDHVNHDRRGLRAVSRDGGGTRRTVH